MMLTVNNNGKVLEIILKLESMNINNSDMILKELKEAALKDSKVDIMLDFKQVRFVDSSAIAMLVSFVQSLARSKRKMSIVNVTEQIRTTVKVLNLTNFLNIQ
ncbi:MAG: STAS domain-containing protein [Spirochaetes bacterium]|nr:STAS domain-containing protein [Spirochaetota bacterium]